MNPRKIHVQGLLLLGISVLLAGLRPAAAEDFSNNAAVAIDRMMVCKRIEITGRTETGVLGFEGRCAVTHDCPRDLVSFTVNYYDNPDNPSLSW